MAVEIDQTLTDEEAIKRALEFSHIAAPGITEEDYKKILDMPVREAIRITCDCRVF